MSTHKHIDRICIAVMIIAVLITVLFMNGEALGIEKIVDNDAETYTGTENFTANDLNGAWSDEGATVITLNGSGAKIKGSGAYTYDGYINLTQKLQKTSKNFKKNKGWWCWSGSIKICFFRQFH